MPPLQPFAPAWARSALRDNPTTPEPSADAICQPPSPPRPRFRVKRRNASNLNAPTQQFLASVAAADIPVPSIEEPRVLDEEMVDTMYPISPFDDDMDGIPMTPHDASVVRMFSPPKTPAPGLVPSLSPKQYPNWSIDSTISSLESSPDYESSRPSTAHSTQTSSSLLSYFSLSTDDLHKDLCHDNDHASSFGDGGSSTEDADKTIKAPPSTAAKAKSRRSRWTTAMTQHLWSTYLMYLQDPKVTPFRLAKSGIPPPGVCLRVARETKRSWKGTKFRGDGLDNVGSTTPTDQTFGTFVQWPHTCAATRAHLRELCKANAKTTSRTHQYHANSPTPFGKTAARYFNRRSAPARSPSVFSGQDMAMSLTLATSESMQLQGPLAQLTQSLPEPPAEELPLPLLPPLPQYETGDSQVGLEPLESERGSGSGSGSGYLASPFTLRSYGPSSSNSLPSSFVVNSNAQRQTHSGGRHRTLRSPARLVRSRSTQKRRSKQPLLEPRRIKRPSLGSDLWLDPSTNGDDGPNALRLPEFSSSSLDDRDELFVPRTNLQELFATSHPLPMQPPVSDTLAPPTEAPPRLGSPFSLMSSSFSFPNRLSSASGIEVGTVRRPFATIQQSKDDSAPATRSSLATRLAYIDERLKDFRRDRVRRRSESPL